MLMILVNLVNELGIDILADAVDIIASVLIPGVNSNATINVNGGVMVGY